VKLNRSIRPDESGVDRALAVAGGSFDPDLGNAVIGGAGLLQRTGSFAGGRMIPTLIRMETFELSTNSHDGSGSQPRSDQPHSLSHGIAPRETETRRQIVPFATAMPLPAVNIIRRNETGCMIGRRDS
jgi:hypothetical protein